MNDLRQQVVSLMKEVLEVDLPSDVDFERKDVSNWDSLKHLELVFALEEEFDIRFSSEQVGRLTSLHAILKEIGTQR